MVSSTVTGIRPEIDEIISCKNAGMMVQTLCGLKFGEILISLQNILWYLYFSKSEQTETDLFRVFKLENSSEQKM